MVWNIALLPKARKNVAKFGAAEARRILQFLHHRLRLLENPRDLGKTLAGPSLSGLWRYRVGEYRILCRIEDEILCSIVIKIGHGREVYR